MKTPLTPIEIEVLLWYHYRAAFHPESDSQTVKQATLMWCESGMLVYPPVPWVVPRITKKGLAMIQALCNTPEPHQVWVDGTGKTLLVEGEG